MIDHQRHQAILDALQQQSPRSVPELETLLGASPATIRRDLTFLAEIGKIVRTHGGAFHSDHVDSELSFDRKSRSALKAKSTIADAACRLVKSGSTVFIDAGTTTLELGKRLLQNDKLTIVTNSVPLLNQPRSSGARLIAVGGETRSVSLALVGSVALDWLGRLRFDLAFLGASGIDAQAGPTTTELSEASVKSAVIKRSLQVAVLADRSKWEQPAAVRYADWNEIHYLFTDKAFAAAEKRLLKQQAITLRSTSK